MFPPDSYLYSRFYQFKVAKRQHKKNTTHYTAIVYVREYHILEKISSKTAQKYPSRAPIRLCLLSYKSDIDEAIQTADSYELFLELLKAKGYEIKGSDPAKESLRYISFRPLSSQRFIRGKANTLEENYTRERIQERIENRTLFCSIMCSIIEWVI